MLCRELNRRGWRCELACVGAPVSDEPSLPERARQMGVTVHDGFSFDSDPNLGCNARDVERLSRLINDGGFVIVHAHGSWDHLLAAAALLRGKARPALVRSDHTSREYGGSLLERFQFSARTTDHLIVLSDRLRMRAVDRLGLAPSVVSTVRGAVDTDDYVPREAPSGLKAQLGLAADDVVLGLAARVQRHRRFDVLLEAAQHVQNMDRRLKILVLGRGTHKDKLLDKPIERMGLRDTVLPLGYRRDDYRDVLAVFDAGMMLVPGSDGSCRAAMQMAAMGKPLLVAECGVLPDLVLDGQTGIVVRDTPENLAEAMLEMAQNAERRRQWGLAGRSRMESHFSLQRQTEGVIEVYEKLLAK